MCVYFIYDPRKKRIKIGYSGEVSWRLEGLRSIYNQDLELIGYIRDGDTVLEARYQTTFESIRCLDVPRDLNGCTEWFKPDERLINRISELHHGDSDFVTFLQRCRKPDSKLSVRLVAADQCSKKSGRPKTVWNPVSLNTTIDVKAQTALYQIIANRKARNRINKVGQPTTIAAIVTEAIFELDKSEA